MFEARYDQSWHKYFKKLNDKLKLLAAKTIKKIKENPKKRHMKKGARFFVEEFNDRKYRIVYRIFENINIIRFYFIGNHKEYEKWYKQFF
jgi:hypothetical protein